MPMTARGLAIALGTIAVLVALILFLPVERWMAAGIEVQRQLHGELVAALRAVKAQEQAATWTLIGISFLYGIFHAAGPGHGKAVIATYLAANEDRVRHGLFLSAASSVLQGVTAIVVGGGLVWVLRQSLRQAQGAAADVELASFALIGLVGLVLAFAAGRRLSRGGHHHHDHHDHDHGHHGHEHHHDCGHAGCGHVHGPDARHLAAAPSARQSLALIVSIGLRPCSGAILVLLFANTLDLAWTGIAAVTAMTLGTALTVAVLALLAVHARRLALGLVARRSADVAAIGRWLNLAALAGGLAIAVIGFGLLYGGLRAPALPLF